MLARPRKIEERGVGGRGVIFRVGGCFISLRMLVRSPKMGNGEAVDFEIDAQLLQLDRRKTEQDFSEKGKLGYFIIVSPMSSAQMTREPNGPAEETVMRLLRFASVKRIKEFLAKNQSMYLHYPTSNLKTPLTAAIDRGDTQILALLLEKNSTNLDETITQPCGRTALMYASFASREPEMLQVLLKKGADLQKTDMGWNCLRYAIVGERLKNVEFLLEYGAPIDHKDSQGRTALMISVYYSNLDILSLLLDHGAELEARDNFGFTALQVAILSRKRDAVVVLIERGSDTSVVTPKTGASIGELCRTCMPNILRCIEPKSRAS